jgi:hypothetical protein
MQIEGKVGPVVTTSSLSQGTTGVAMRMGNLGEQIMSELHDKNYEMTYRRNFFTASMQGIIATATIAGLNVSTTGSPVIYNPLNSGINVILSKVGVGFALAPATEVIYGLATGYNATTAVSGTLTSLVPKSRYIGVGALPIAQVYCSAAITLPTVPTVDVIFGTCGQGAITTSQNGCGNLFSIDGGIILPPGAYAIIWTHAIMLASSLMASYSWEEVPL